MALSSKSRIVKRAIDVVMAFLGLAVFWPVILVCVVVARIDTGESGIFRQSRVGKNGELFDVFKIRTMYKVAGNQTTVTVEDDVRISSSGAIFRNYKLDELPQLWNVLIGQMSLVGPRPDVPGYLDRLIGEDRRLLELRPGITGPATLKYRDEQSLLAQQTDPESYNDDVLFPDKVAINLDYLDNHSLLQDIAYILMTVRLKQIPKHLVIS